MYETGLYLTDDDVKGLLVALRVGFYDNKFLKIFLKTLSKGLTFWWETQINQGLYSAPTRRWLLWALCVENLLKRFAWPSHPLSHSTTLQVFLIHVFLAFDFISILLCVRLQKDFYRRTELSEGTVKFYKYTQSSNRILSS